MPIGSIVKYLKLADLAVGYIISRDLQELAQLTRYKIAEHFGVNRNYLSKIFKEGTQMTVLEFIEFEKLKRGELLLKTRLDLSVKDISLQLGIADVRQFRKKFKNTFGLNPGKYRTLYKV
jgi:two-component system response regulator YesN